MRRSEQAAPPKEVFPDAGRELDALVAERVMGWPHEHMLIGLGTPYDPMHFEPPRAAYRRRSHVDGFWERWSPTGADVVVSHFVPPYSTDIRFAMEVLAHLNGERWFVDLWNNPDGDWNCQVGTFPPVESLPLGVRLPAPHAICLAALRAVGVPELPQTQNGEKNE